MSSFFRYAKDSRHPPRSGARWAAAHAAGLPLRQPAVAAHVAVLPAGHQVDRGLVAHALDLPDRRRVDPRQPARAEQEGLVVQRDLALAAVQEVQLPLLLVEVPAGLVARRQLDRVHAECLDPERPAHLAEAGTLREPVDVRDGVAVALHDFPHLVGHARSLIGAATKPRAPRCAARRGPTARSARPAEPPRRTPAAPSSGRPRETRAPTPAPAWPG